MGPKPQLQVEVFDEKIEAIQSEFNRSLQDVRSDFNQLPKEI